MPSTWLEFFEPGRAAVDQQRAPGARGRAAAATTRKRTRAHDARARLRTALAAGVRRRRRRAGVGRARSAPTTSAPCSVGEVPGSERLADTHEKDNPAFDRMHVEQAQELATGRGVKVAVIDSGMVGGEGLDVSDGGRDPRRRPPGTRLSGHGTIVAGLIAGPHGVAPDAAGLRRQGLRRRGRRHDAGASGR